MHLAGLGRKVHAHIVRVFFDIFAQCRNGSLKVGPRGRQGAGAGLAARHRCAGFAGGLNAWGHQGFIHRH